MNIPQWMFSQMKDGLSSLGYRRYREYLQSPGWFETCGRLLHEQCDRCPNRTRLVLHHKHYNTLGYEQEGDVLTLCPACHQAEHVKLMENEPKPKPKKRHPSKQVQRKQQAVKLLMADPASTWIHKPKTPADRQHNQDLTVDMMVKLDQQRRCKKYSFDYEPPVSASNKSQPIRQAQKESWKRRGYIK